MARFPPKLGGNVKGHTHAKAGFSCPGDVLEKMRLAMLVCGSFRASPPPFSPRADKSSHVAYPTPVSHGAYHISRTVPWLVFTATV